MTTAFESKGLGWYAADAIPNLNFRYAWNDTHVNGVIEIGVKSFVESFNCRWIVEMKRIVSIKG